MDCVTCGTDNEVGRKFCRNCGTRLGSVCAQCGTFNAGDARFCGECGSPLVVMGGSQPTHPTRPAAEIARTPTTHDGSIPTAGTGAPASAGTAPLTASADSERRVVSVLFVDLVGFTPFAEGRAAEEVRDTLSRYFD